MLNQLTSARVYRLLAATEADVPPPAGPATLGWVRRSNKVACSSACQTLLFTGQAQRIILAPFENTVEPDWNTPQASFVLGDCSDPADMRGGGALDPINVARGLGVCIQREADRPLSEADHTVFSGYFTRSYLLGPSMSVNTARYYVRDAAVQRLVQQQTSIVSYYLKVPLMLNYDFTGAIGRSATRSLIGFRGGKAFPTNSDVHPNETNILRLAGLDIERQWPMQGVDVSAMLLDALAKRRRPRAQDEALARIAYLLVAQPELLPAGRDFVEEFTDTHPLALQPKFSDQMREHDRGDLLRRMSVRLPDEVIDALEAKDTGKLENSFALLAKQPAVNRAIVFDQLMAVFAEASNRRSLHPLPALLANVNAAGPAYISMLERRPDWPAADRAALAYAACTANLDLSGWARLEAILRADLHADAERIADADITVSISGLANAGLGQVEIAELMEQHLGPLDTVPLMPSNVRPVSAAKETSLLRLNLAWIAHLAKGDCENRLG